MSTTPALGLTGVFLHLAQHPQLGWSAMGIKAAETIYEHSSEMAAMARYFVPRHYPDVDAAYCAEMCMVHGLTEAITPASAPAVRTATWRQHALQQIEQRAGNDPHMARAKAIFTEYHENTTPAARLANQLDRLQMASQLLRYETDIATFGAGVLWGIARHGLTDAPLLAAYNRMVEARPVDADDRKLPSAIRIRDVDAAAAHREVLARVGDLTPVIKERQAAFARYPYRRD